MCWTPVVEAVLRATPGATESTKWIELSKELDASTNVFEQLHSNASLKEAYLTRLGSNVSKTTNPFIEPGSFCAFLSTQGVEPNEYVRLPTADDFLKKLEDTNDAIIGVISGGHAWYYKRGSANKNETPAPTHMIHAGDVLRNMDNIRILSKKYITDEVGVFVYNVGGLTVSDPNDESFEPPSCVQERRAEMEIHCINGDTIRHPRHVSILSEGLAGSSSTHEQGEAREPESECSPTSIQ